ncbi:non-ribosomal peptide synthetase [Crossiella sp. CA198]|uniref:non-ribosomal peptide synthetase n=1 Tax=Crossiella sp. CA198 TaxID=3455607 RepID=UPI003F8D0200
MRPAETASGTALGPAPATRKEEALWLLESMVPGSAINNLSFAFRAEGRLDPVWLRAALAHVVQRFEVLRTVFHAAGASLAKQVLDRVDIKIEHLDPAGRDPEEVLTAFLARPFALDGRPLLRAARLRGADGADRFCLVLHHLVFDSLSTPVLRAEFAAAYTALAKGEQPEPGEPVRALVEPPPSADSLAFWRERLDQFDPGTLELAIGTQGVPDPVLRGAQVTHELSPRARSAVRALQRELRAPEAVVLLAGYYLLLAQHGAGPDLTVGFPVNTRGSEDSGAIGFHVNVIPLRVRVPAAQSFREFTRAVRTVFFDGLTHADVPVEHLSGFLPRRSASWREALFKHVLNYVAADERAPFDLAGAPAEPLLLENGSSRFDLEFFVLSTAEHLRVRAAYCVEFYEHTEVEALLHRFEELLIRLADDVDRVLGEVEVCSAADRSIIDAANDTAVPVHPADVLTGVLHQVTTRPGAIAVEHEDRQVSYRELWDTAAAVAGQLRAAGIGAGEVVAVAAPRSPELAAAVLGIWFAGAAYLPVDPEHPAERITYQLTDSGAKAVLTTDPGLLPAGPIPVLTIATASAQSTMDSFTLAADSAAMIIYTSGSTGLPKGTWISHGNLANVMFHFGQTLRVSEEDGFLWLTTFSFDISELELFLPLLAGGRVVVAPDEARTDGKALRRVLENHPVHLVQATPTTWRLVLEDAAPALAGCRLSSGGEPLTEDLARRLNAVAPEVWNFYGPTETTIWSTTDRITGGPVGIGGPIANTQVFVCSPTGAELPIGVRGELCIAGAGVALGYHTRPELTAERFPWHPRYGRYYRTGDLARWRPDGSIELFGRNDRQVKLRGNRIELPEVEAVLREHPRVRAAAAVIVPDETSGGLLVACIEGAEEPTLAAQLWGYAAERLPVAATPNDFVFLDAFPETGNNKVDYPALTRLATEHRRDRVPAAAATEPGDGLVGALVALWRELLERSDVDAEANFFAHGGHSVLAARIVQRLAESTGVRIKLSGVFEHPTPQLLARHLAAAGVAPLPQEA